MMRSATFPDGGTGILDGIAERASGAAVDGVPVAVEHGDLDGAFICLLSAK